MVNSHSAQRLAIVDLRHRIEVIAVVAVESALPTLDHFVEQTEIAKRLAFLPVAYEKKAPVSDLLGMVRVARHIYKRSSDVLHGRSSMVNLSNAMINEWLTAVERIEFVVSS